MGSFEPILRSFLEELDAIYEEDDGVTDTDVREILAETIVERLVRGNRKTLHPQKL